MTKSIRLKRIISLAAGLSLAFAGSLTTGPAQAATFNSVVIDSGQTGPGGHTVVFSVTSCPFQGFQGINDKLSDFSVSIDGALTTPIEGSATAWGITLNLGSRTLAAGELVSISYTPTLGAITCSNGTDSVGGFSPVSIRMPVAAVLATSSPNATGVTSTSGNVTFTNDLETRYVWSARLATSAVPSNLGDINSGVTWTSDDLVHSNGSNTAPANGSTTIAVTGLAQNTNYKVYVWSVTTRGLVSNTLAVTLSTLASGGGGGGVSFCSPSVTISSIAWSEAAMSPSTTVRSIYNSNPAIGITQCQAAFSSPNVGILYKLNGAVIGTPVRNTTYMPTVSSNAVNWSALTTGGVALAGQNIQDGDVFTTNYYVGIGSTPTLSDIPTFGYSLALYPSGIPTVAPAPSLPVSAQQALNILKPVPAAVQPLVPALIALNKPMASLGGKVELSAGDFTGLQSAKVAGKTIDFILGKTGQITMTLPQGEVGQTADLVLTFNTGSIILQDAIKYVAPVIVANVPARPITISSSSKALSAEAQSQIRQAAFANVKNTAVACVGYASANDASARAAALALATKACAIANKANSDLGITGINVVVDKLKARTQGVGIKVYKADN